MCQIVKKMSNCQKDVKCQIAGLLRRLTKNKLTQWGSHTLTSILTSHVKVIKIGQKCFLWTFEGFWWPLYVTSNLTSSFVNFLHSQCSWLFDTWHIHVSHLVVDVFSEFSEYIHWLCEYLPGDEFIVLIFALK